MKLFVVGRNEWRYEEEWPPEQAQPTEFFLHSEGKANTVSGDGVLSTNEPGEERPDSYTYDPRDPVMSLMDADAQAAPRDQAPNDGRADVLVYQTPPLEQEVEVIGPVVLKLWASTSAPDTDFTAKLIDVHPRRAGGEPNLRHRAGPVQGGIQPAGAAGAGPTVRVHDQAESRRGTFSEGAQDPA